MASIENSTYYNAYTEGQTTIHEIKWTVPNFVLLIEKKSTRELRSIKLENPDDLSESRFQLKMQFLGKAYDIIEIYYVSPTPVLLRFTLANNSRTELETSKYHTVQANKWQYITTLRDYNTGMSYNRNFVLHFQFFVINGIKVDCSIPEAQLSNDFENLLGNGLFSDLTMKSSEQIEYKVHKVVLASRSAVLKAHFEHNTTECFTNVVESSFESEVLSEVLTFIYSDKAPMVDEIPEKLLAAADYYQLSGLKNLCVKALHKKLTVENAIETLQLADLHSASALQQLTLEFIKDGQAELITKTKAWGEVKSVEFIKRIYEYIMAANQRSE